LYLKGAKENNFFDHHIDNRARGFHMHNVTSRSVAWRGITLIFNEGISEPDLKRIGFVQNWLTLVEVIFMRNIF
jgi:hypothetical protein